MSDNKDWFQSSGVPSFAQMLKKNLSNSTFFYNSESSFRIFIIRGSQCVEFRASKFIQITKSLLSKIDLLNPNVLCPKKIPKKLIMQYKGGEINPVSALHQFAQMQHVKLGLQETVATGNAMGPQFVFCAVVDGIRYKTELGQNKKESLSNAAKITLGELLQVDDPEPRNVETSALKV